MLIRFLISFFLILFVAACATQPVKTVKTEGGGSSSDSESGVSSSAGELTSVDYTSDVPSDYVGIYPGSQEDLIVNVGDRVYFGFDSFELDADAKELLQDQAAWLKQYNKSSITIEGHCDERGTREYNLALGEKRAQAVKNYLNGLGISKSSLSTISYGKERPAVIGSNDAAWGQNRRSVTIVN
tara:strand:+ start:268 stop:819 length:552 start_codon:yes stop_codon:yes gene_type:complete